MIMKVKIIMLHYISLVKLQDLYYLVQQLIIKVIHLKYLQLKKKNFLLLDKNKHIILILNHF